MSPAENGEPLQMPIRYPRVRANRDNGCVSGDIATLAGGAKRPAKFLDSSG